MTTPKLPKLPRLPKAKTYTRCACGCTGLTQSRFVPGHDATLASMVKRVKRGLWVPTAEGDAIDAMAQLDACAAKMTPGMAMATAEELGLGKQYAEHVKKATTAKAS